MTTASDEFSVPLFRAEREAHDCEDEAAWWKASRFLKEDGVSLSQPLLPGESAEQCGGEIIVLWLSIKRSRSETATIYTGSPYQSKRLYKLPEGRVGTTAYQPIIGGHKW